MAWGGGVSWGVVWSGEGGEGDLDDHEAGAAAVGGGEVDAGLVARNVEALDGGALLERGGARGGDGEDGGDDEGGELHGGDLGCGVWVLYLHPEGLEDCTRGNNKLI